MSNFDDLDRLILGDCIPQPAGSPAPTGDGASTRQQTSIAQDADNSRHGDVATETTIGQAPVAISQDLVPPPEDMPAAESPALPQQPHVELALVEHAASKGSLSAISAAISEALRHFRPSRDSEQLTAVQAVQPAIIHKHDALPPAAKVKPLSPRRLAAASAVLLVAGIGGSIAYSHFKPRVQESPLVVVDAAQRPQAASGALGAPTDMPVSEVAASAPITPALDAAVEPSASRDGPLPTGMLGRGLPALKDLPPPKQEEPPETLDPKRKPLQPSAALPAATTPAIAGRAQHPIAAEIEDEAESTPIRAKGKESVSQALIPKQAPAAAKVDTAKPVTAAAESTPKTVSSAADSKESDTRKFGWQGIALVTKNGVIVTGKSGQREILVGAKLPDGSLLKAVDAKQSRITTDRGQVSFSD